MCHIIVCLDTVEPIIRATSNVETLRLKYAPEIVQYFIPSPNGGFYKVLPYTHSLMCIGVGSSEEVERP